MSELTHLDAEGRAHMVDVGEKNVTWREAVARGAVLMRPETLQLIMAGGLPKGDVLAVARVAGESAPLLFTALFSNYWLSSLGEPTASLSILIYNFSSMPFDNQIELAWTASLVLVLIVLVFNIVSRLIGRPKV